MDIETAKHAEKMVESYKEVNGEEALNSLRRIAKRSKMKTSRRHNLKSLLPLIDPCEDNWYTYNLKDLNQALMERLTA